MLASFFIPPFENVSGQCKLPHAIHSKRKWNKKGLQQKRKKQNTFSEQFSHDNMNARVIKVVGFPAMKSAVHLSLSESDGWGKWWKAASLMVSW